LWCWGLWKSAKEFVCGSPSSQRLPVGNGSENNRTENQYNALPETNWCRATYQSLVFGTRHVKWIGGKIINGKGETRKKNRMNAVVCFFGFYCPAKNELRNATRNRKKTTMSKLFTEW
jgi:hypothetical protein